MHAPGPPGYAPAPPAYPPPVPGYGVPYSPYAAYAPYAYVPPADNLGSGRFRARRAAELLDDVFTTYRHNLAVILSTSAVIQVPFSLITFAVEWSTDFFGINNRIAAEQAAGLTSQANNDLGTLIGVLFLILAIQFLVVFPVVQATMARIVSDRYLNGQASMRSAYGAAGSRLLPLAGTSLLMVLIVGAAYIASSLVAGILSLVLVAVGGGSSVVAAVIVFIVILLTVGVACFYVYGRVASAPAVVILERAGPGTAIGRAWSLTRGAEVRTAITVFMAFLLTWLLGAGLNLLVTQLTNQVTGTIISSITGVFTAPILPITATLIYYDRRIRRESFDVEMLVHQL
jgi:hypothetical protein